jgi:hypothetical protein
MKISHKNASIYRNFNTKVEISTLGYCTMSRHNKHSNFYWTANIWKLILGKFLNYKTIDLCQKPRTWIRRLGHFKPDKGRELKKESNYVSLPNAGYDLFLLPTSRQLVLDVWLLYTVHASESDSAVSCRNVPTDEVTAQLNSWILELQDSRLYNSKTAKIVLYLFIRTLLINNKPSTGPRCMIAVHCARKRWPECS